MLVSAPVTAASVAGVGKSNAVKDSQIMRRTVDLNSIFGLNVIIATVFI